MAAATIPSPTSGSSVIQTTLTNESGRIGGDVWRYAYDTSPWARIIKRGSWPEGMGSQIGILNYERALTGTTNGKGTWVDHVALGASSAATGNTPPDISTSRGLPPASVTQATARLRFYNLAWTAVESVRFNVNDGMFSFQFKEQIKNIYEMLRDSAMRVWSYRTREEYFRLAQNKYVIGINTTGATTSALADLSVVGPSNFDTMLQYSLAQLNATGSTVGSGFSTAHGVLTNGVLRDIYARLCRVGAGIGSGGMSNGAPVFYLLCSPETSDYLVREPGTRSDLRWGNAGELLKPLGVDRSFNGFSHVVDHEVPRFTLALVGSLYDFTEVLPWTYQAGSISTAVSSATATGAPTGCYVATVTSTNGIVAGQYVDITVSSASDEEVQGTYRVRSVASSTTVIIENPNFTDTFAGTLVTRTNGQAGWVENTSYHTAPYEMSFIMHPEVMEALQTTPATSLGSGSEFEPRASIGDFKFKNIPNEIDNPDGTFGYWRGILEFASKPVKTAFGWAIMHRRPDPVYTASPVLSLTSGLGLTS